MEHIGFQKLELLMKVVAISEWLWLLLRLVVNIDDRLCLRGWVAFRLIPFRLIPFCLILFDRRTNNDDLLCRFLLL